MCSHREATDWIKTKLRIIFSDALIYNEPNHDPNYQAFKFIRESKIETDTGLRFNIVQINDKDKLHISVLVVTNGLFED